MKNKKGFTLVELLVAIAIMGIITAIAIPMIRNIREGNENKEYQTYSESLKHAAKLYLSSYEEDIFGREESGCAIISYQQLKKRDLIKDIPIDKTTCEGNDTFVKVVKIDGKYGYSTSIVCKERVDDSFKETYKYPEGGIPNADICSVQSDIIMDISANPASSNSIKYKRRSIKLTIKSDTGIDNNVQLSYGFSTDKNTSIMNDWELVSLTVPGKENQKNKILNGNTIEVTSNKINTPENLTGEYYLVVRVNKLQDLAGKEWKKEASVEGEDNILYFGPYVLDNTPPELNTSTIISSENTFNSNIPKLNFAATDNMSSEADMKMCISYETDTCSKSTEDIKANNGYEIYNKSKELPQISNGNNGSDHKIYVTIADAAGNYTTQEYDYKVDLIYQLSYTLDGGSHGTNHPTQAKADDQITINNPTKAVLVTLEVPSGITISYTGATITSASQSFAYTFVGWDITNMTNSPHVYGTTTATEVSSTGRKETTFKNLRNDLGTVNFTAKWTPPSIKLPTITKTGHTCVWSSEGLSNKASGATYTPASTNGATERTFVANCTANTYTIKYNNNGGTGTMSNTTCTYGTPCTIAASTFKKVGYHVAKYNTKAEGAGGSYYDADGTKTVTNLTATNNGVVTLYARWTKNFINFIMNGNGGTWCGKPNNGHRMSTDPEYPGSKGYVEHYRAASDEWNVRFRYEYDYIVGTDYIENNPDAHGFANYDHEDAVCFKRKNYHAVPGKEWKNKAGTKFIDQKKTDYNSIDLAKDFAPDCDFKHQDCTAIVYVNWVHD